MLDNCRVQTGQRPANLVAGIIDGEAQSVLSHQRGEELLAKFVRIGKEGAGGKPKARLGDSLASKTTSHADRKENLVRGNKGVAGEKAKPFA